MHSHDYSIVQFLPYSATAKFHAAIRVGLKELHALTGAFLETIEAFHKKNLMALDSLVGENACQIRAVKHSILATEKSIDLRSLHGQISNVRQKIEALLSSKSIECLMKSESSLQHIIDTQDLDIKLSFQEHWLLRAFLLTVMKTPLNQADDLLDSIYRYRSSHTKYFKRFGDVSTEFTKTLLNQSRRALAKASVEYIRKLAFMHQEADLIEKISDSFTHLHNTLPCIPMFWTYKVVINEAKRIGIPLVIHAKFLKKEGEKLRLENEEFLLFDVVDGRYQISQRKISPGTPCWVVQGAVVEDNEGNLLNKKSWLKVIKQTPIVDVILAGAADHRQYPDPSLDQIFQDAELDHYKELAKTHGFAADNPTTFFIQHVYADTVAEQHLENVPERPEGFFNKGYDQKAQNTRSYPR